LVAIAAAFHDIAISKAARQAVETGTHHDRVVRDLKLGMRFKGDEATIGCEDIKRDVDGRDEARL
jgi:hypothetical protein